MKLLQHRNVIMIDITCLNMIGFRAEKIQIDWLCISVSIYFVLWTAGGEAAAARKEDEQEGFQENNRPSVASVPIVIPETFRCFRFASLFVFITIS